MFKNFKESIASVFDESVVPAFKIVAVLWVIHLINIFTLFNLNNFGIHPRNIFGLIGIPLAPFLHSNMAHLVSNSVPLFILLALLFSFNGKIASEVLISIALASGLGTWLFGASQSIHIGVSGIIFGLIGFLILAGIYRRKFSAIIVSVIVLFLFGGSILLMIIPMPGISWTGHIFGFLGGAYAAKKLAKN